MLSRAADACYWMSRYIERAENTASIVDVNMQLLLDFEDHGPHAARRNWTPLLESFEAGGLFSKLGGSGDRVMDFLTFEKKNPNSIISCIAVARENARTIREQISSSMWERINSLHLYLRSPSAKADFLSSPNYFYRRIVEGSHLFQGVTDATMSHGEGWEFIQAGKFLERADNTSRLLDIKYHLLLPDGNQAGSAADMTQWMAVLRSCGGLDAHMREAGGEVRPDNVAEFLILNEDFPRSIRFCADQLDRSLHQIGGASDQRFNNESERLSGLLRSNLDYMTIARIHQTGLHGFLDNIQLRLIDISAAIKSDYFSAGEN